MAAVLHHTGAHQNRGSMGVRGGFRRGSTGVRGGFGFPCVTRVFSTSSRKPLPYTLGSPPLPPHGVPGMYGVPGCQVIGECIRGVYGVIFFFVFSSPFLRRQKPVLFVNFTVWCCMASYGKGQHHSANFSWNKGRGGYVRGYRGVHPWNPCVFNEIVRIRRTPGEPPPNPRRTPGEPPWNPEDARG